MPSWFSRAGSVAAVGLITVSLAGCSSGGFIFGASPLAESTPTATPTPTATVAPFESEFSDMGSVHPVSIVGPQLELNLDLWTEQKTHEWTNDGEKMFSTVINVIDQSVPADAAFALKRQVFMSNVTVTATPVDADGEAGTAMTLLNIDPVAATLDPEALKSDYGLLITSPKGGFQLESTDLGELDDDVTGVVLDFAMTITSETAGGSAVYAQQVVAQTVPIAIYTDAEAEQASAESSDGEN
ncbi:MAG: hypothetical protein JWQ43_2210 [Glaciihabitans sp.]|nr:hypothetical protein [Glaciihabitans sp.]